MGWGGGFRTLRARYTFLKSCMRPYLQVTSKIVPDGRMDGQRNLQLCALQLNFNSSLHKIFVQDISHRQVLTLFY